MIISLVPPQVPRPTSRTASIWRRWRGGAGRWPGSGCGGMLVSGPPVPWGGRHHGLGLAGPGRTRRVFAAFNWRAELLSLQEHRSFFQNTDFPGGGRSAAAATASSAATPQCTANQAGAAGGSQHPKSSGGPKPTAVLMAVICDGPKPPERRPACALQLACRVVESPRAQILESLQILEIFTLPGPAPTHPA